MKNTMIALAAAALVAAAVPNAAEARCHGCGVAAGVVGGLAAGAIIGGAIAASQANAAAQQHQAYCAQRYRSYDPGSDTFLARDGNRYQCR
jgi:hypothetical protein